MNMLNFDALNLPNDLPVEVQRKLFKLLSQFPNLFANDEKDCGATNLVEHKINTGENKPVRKFPYRISPKQKKSLPEKCNYWKKNRSFEKAHHHGLQIQS